jgi:hypothetical protein
MAYLVDMGCLPVFGELHLNHGDTGKLTVPTNMPQPDSLLDELDALQDQVLRDLDLLDERILAIIRQCVQTESLPPTTAGSLASPSEIKPAA